MTINASILSEVIEKLSDSELSFDDRQIVYEILLEVYEDFEVKNLEQCVEIDRAFDAIWYEKYPELEDEDD